MAVGRRGASQVPLRGDGAPRQPEDTVTPASLAVSKCDLFEQYVRELRPEMLNGWLAWLDCGSGAHGGYADWELGEDGAHPLGEYEAAAIRIRVRDAIRRGWGTVPAGWERWAEGIAEPTEDWRALLGAAFRAGIFGSSPRYQEDSDQAGPAAPDWAETVYLR
jgi:hypothetical protein